MHKSGLNDSFTNPTDSALEFTDSRNDPESDDLNSVDLSHKTIV